ncbi:hypothetical protein MBLNU230_g4815t1 [Neophaeotheca triangularis]
MFKVLKSTPNSMGPRLGQLTFPNRPPIETPNYLALTSRGTVPHLTQDNLNRSTAIPGVYAGLEDFIERADAPIYHVPVAEKLRRFIALPKSSVLVLGARRALPVQAPAATPNTENTIAVCTSVGFTNLRAEEFAARSEELRPDVVVAMADVPFKRALGSKRIEKATDRSIQWVGDHVKLRERVVDEHNGIKARTTTTNRTTNSDNTHVMEPLPALFAPLLPVSCINQQYYIETLTSSDVLPSLSGLAIYNLDSLPDLPPPLDQLPRLGFTSPQTPHDLLTHISHGVDLHTIPFLETATDAGIALDFTFPPPPPSSQTTAPLGHSLWNPSQATSLDPLTPSCNCKTCKTHHNAFLHHLLQAKEMLAWVLLAIHNHHVIDGFFRDVRKSIREGRWEEDCGNFELFYEAGLPEGGGVGPRVRGYMFRSEGQGEERRNEKTFVRFGNGENGVENRGE